MQKVTDFLERNVQWLVLGLAGLVLLLMVWLFVLTPPVTVEADGKKLTPGEIDAATARGPVQQIRQKIAYPGDIPPELKVQDYGLAFNQAFAPQQLAYDTLNPWSFPRQPGARPIGDRGPELAGSTTAKPTTLPTAVAATWSAGSNGRSVVLLPDPKARRRRNDDVNVQPVDMIEVDKDWVTQAFEIDVEKLADSFKAAFGDFEDLPPSVYDTSIVHVELVREEKLENGSWGKRTVVKPLAIHEVPPFPTELNDIHRSLEYNVWAQANPQLITTPPFYQVAETGGDPWMEPGSEVSSVVAPTSPVPRSPAYPRGGYPAYPGVPGGAGGFNPGGRGRGPAYPGGLGYPPGYGQPQPGRRGSGNRAPNYAMQDAGRSFNPGGTSGRGSSPGYPPVYPGMMPPGYSSGGYGGYSAGTSAGAGGFNVLNVTEPIRVWAHDDTVEAGKTYRYAIHYYLRNPLFQTFNIAAKKELSEQYAIKSELSRWSSQVRITPKVNFFLAGVGKDNAKFEVFTWTKGTWKKKVITRSPGDLIPDTTWTVVDQRKDGNETYVLLMGQGGQIVRRNFSEDRKSNLYLDLNTQVEAAKGATAAAGQ